VADQLASIDTEVIEKVRDDLRVTCERVLRILRTVAQPVTKEIDQHAATSRETTLSCGHGHTGYRRVERSVNEHTRRKRAGEVDIPHKGLFSLAEERAHQSVVPPQRRTA